MDEMDDRNNEETISFSLFSAVQYGKLETVRKLINTYGLSYSPDWFEGYALLVGALMSSRTDVAKLLITSGCRLNKANDKPDETPLHFAVIKEYIDIIEMLLDKGAIIDRNHNFGLTPLLYGIYNKNVSRSLWNLDFGINATDIVTDNDVSLFHLAVKGGCLQIIEHLLKQGADINSVVSNGLKKGYTPLHLAVESGNEKVFMLFINKGLCIDSKAENDITPLHVACKEGNAIIAEKLINRGASIHSLTSSNYTPLQIAVYCEKEKVVKLLLQHGANINHSDVNNETILHDAVKTKNLTIINDIINHCPDINNESNKNSLKIAVLEYKNCADKCKIIIDLLLQYGLTFKTEDLNDPKLLRAAVKNGFLKVIEYLLNHGLDVNMYQNLKNKEPILLTALKNEQYEVAKLFISHGADVNAQDKNKETPIYHSSNLNMTKILLNNGANVKDHPKILFNAVKNVEINFVKYFLKHDAHVEAQDDRKRTPLHFTAYRVRGQAKFNSYIPDPYMREEIAKMLLRNGADIDALTYKGETTLHGAVKNGFELLVKLLLKYGSDINITTKDDKTPLSFLCLDEDSFKDFIMSNEYDNTYGCMRVNDHENSFYNRYGSYRPINDYNYYRLSYLTIAKILHYHIIKMRVANLYVNDTNLNLVDFHCYVDFQDKCMKEIARMKNVYVNNTNSLTFYDILTKSTNLLEMYMRNKIIIEDLKLGIYEIEFPLYANMLKNNFRKSLERKKLIELSKTILQLLFKNNPQLPCICTEKILSFMDNQDLKNLLDLHPSSYVSYCLFMKNHNGFFIHCL